MSDEEYQYSDEEVGLGDEVMEEEEEEVVVLDHQQQQQRSTNRSSYQQQISPSKSEERYLVLDAIAIKKEQEKMIEHVRELLATNFHTTQRILMEYRWNSEDVLNDFMEHGQEKVLTRAGVNQPTTVSSKQKSTGVVAASTSCDICYDTLTGSNSMMNPSCGHEFCFSCWEGHILMKISEGKSRRIPCPQHKCNSVVDPNIITKILEGNQDSLRKYEKGMSDSFIDDNPRAKWCPSKPCCGRAIKISDSSSFRIDCECLAPCGEVFCFHCGEATHTPIPCEWAENWKKKCASESENATFILAHCKPCPKCKKPIQKGDGCNHVTCICGQYMCWLCGAATGLAHDANSIVGHTCDKFRLKTEQRETAKQQLDLYVHYFEKYEIHMQSLRKAKEVEKTVNQTVEILNGKVNQDIQDNELADWLWIGLHQLFRMRRFIAWTYVFAFYAFHEENGKQIQLEESKNAQAASSGGYFHQTIFEDLQSKLQNSIESLSSQVEGRADQMTKTTKPNVLKLASATHNQAINLWKFIDHDLLSVLLGKFGYIGPNVYFPIRRMVTGLGAKAMNENDNEGTSFGTSSVAISASVATDNVKNLKLDAKGGNSKQRKKRGN